MQRLLAVYFIAEIFAIALYAWQSVAWYGWKLAGADAFPGSPDAIYYYRLSEKLSGWFEGLVAGLFIGALSLSAATFARPSSTTWFQKNINITVWFFPLAALAIVNVAFFMQPLH